MLYKSFYKSDNKKSEIPLKTDEAIQKMSLFSENDKNFNLGFVKTKSEFKIKELYYLERRLILERKMNAKKVCLAEGFQLEDFDFNQEETLLKFGQKPIEIFAD